MGMIHEMVKEALSGKKPNPGVYVRRVPDDLEEPPENPEEYSRPVITPRTEKGPGTGG